MKTLLLLLLALVCVFAPAFAATPGQHSVTLTWSEASCPSCTFNVYRATVANVCAAAPAPYASGVLTTSYSDLAVTAGQQYFYAVSAVNGGESACSSEVQVTVPTSPASPTNLQGTAK